MAVASRASHFLKVYKHPSPMRSANSVRKLLQNWSSALEEWRQVYFESLRSFAEPENEPKFVGGNVDDEVADEFAINMPANAEYKEWLDRCITLDELGGDITDLALRVDALQEPDVDVRELESEVNAEVGPAATQAFCHWFEHGNLPAGFNSVRFSTTARERREEILAGRTFSEFVEVALHEDELVSDGQLAEVDPHEDERVDDLWAEAVDTAMITHCLQQSSDSAYVDLLCELRRDARYFIRACREAHRAGLRLMIDTVLSQTYSLKSVEDFKAFSTLSKSVLATARDAFFVSPSLSLLGFDAADVVRWAFPLLSANALDYELWRESADRLLAHELTPRDMTTECNSVAWHFVGRVTNAAHDCGVTTVNPTDIHSIEDASTVIEQRLRELYAHKAGPQNPKRKHRWTRDEAESFVLTYLMRAQRDDREVSIRTVARDTSIPKSTIQKTEAWKSLGSDARRKVIAHSPLAENVTVPKSAGTA